MTALAICIDDVGQNAAIDTAALRLAALGRISACSCLVYGPTALDSAAALRELRADIDIGLHLDLTEGWGGRQQWQPWSRLVVEAYGGLLDQRRLRSEIGRQLDAFGRLFGRAPDHVDGHRHVHQLPGVREVLTFELAARGAAPWLRCNRSGERSPLGSKPWAVACGWRGLVLACARHRLPHNHRLLGVYRFDGDNTTAYRQRLTRWLNLARDGDLLMCHAATTLASDDPIATARVAEFRVLASPAFDDALSATDVRVTRLSATLRHPPWPSGTAR